MLVLFHGVQTNADILKVGLFLNFHIVLQGKRGLSSMDSGKVKITYPKQEILCSMIGIMIR